MEELDPLTLIVAGLAAACIACAMPVFAQQRPAPTAAELAAQNAERERTAPAMTRAESDRRVQRARQNCLENRGVDCDSERGLQEWLVLERSRAEAVLDRVMPEQVGRR